jgi:hypothetical protein
MDNQPGLSSETESGTPVVESTSQNTTLIAAREGIGAFTSNPEMTAPIDPRNNGGMDVPTNIFKIQTPEGTPGFMAGADTGFREVAGVTTLVEKPDQPTFRMDKGYGAAIVGQQAETSVRAYGADVAQQRIENINKTVEKVTNAVEAVGRFFTRVENLKQKARNVDATVTGWAFKVGTKVPSALGEAAGVTVAVGGGVAVAPIVVPVAIGFGAYTLAKKALIETYKFAGKAAKWVGEKAVAFGKGVGHIVVETGKGIAKGTKATVRELEYGYIPNAVAVNVINAADNVAHTVLVGIVNGMERKASRNNNTDRPGETALSGFFRETLVKEGLLAAKTDALKAKSDSIERNKGRRMALQRIGRYVLTGKSVGPVPTTAFSAAPTYNTVDSNANLSSTPLI